MKFKHCPMSSPYFAPSITSQTNKNLAQIKDTTKNKIEVSETKRGSFGNSKVTLEEAFQILHVTKELHWDVDKEFKDASSKISTEDIRELKGVIAATEISLPGLKYQNEASRQKLIDDTLKALLPKFSGLLKIQGEKFCEFPISAANIPWLIPLIALVKVKRTFSDALGHILAMIKGIDSKNLQNGFNIPVYYAIVTDVKVWTFIKVTTHNGYAVSVSEDMWWGSRPLPLNETILKYLYCCLSNAADIVKTIEKGKSTTPERARSLKEDYTLWSSVELAAYMNQFNEKFPQNGYDAAILEADFDGSTLSDVAITHVALEELGITLAKKAHLHLFHILRKHLEEKKQAYINRTKEIVNDVAMVLELSDESSLEESDY